MKKSFYKKSSKKLYTGMYTKLFENSEYSEKLTAFNKSVVKLSPKCTRRMLTLVFGRRPLCREARIIFKALMRSKVVRKGVFVTESSYTYSWLRYQEFGNKIEIGGKFILLERRIGFECSDPLENVELDKVCQMTPKKRFDFFVNNCQHLYVNINTGNAAKSVFERHRLLESLVEQVKVV